MMELHSTPLTHLAALAVNGKDATTFLQGQCTQDVANMVDGSSAAGAFCTAKGRTVTNVWLVKLATDNLWLICHTTSADLLKKHLSKYIAFFRGTTLTSVAENYTGLGVSSALYKRLTQKNELPESAVHFELTSQLHHIWFSHQDGDTPVVTALKACQTNTNEQWRANEIRQKLLWLDSDQSEVWIPQNISLDAIDGISFKKGCYTGQEVVARLHYKGVSKKRLHSISWGKHECASAAKVYANGSAVGNLIQQAKTASGFVGLVVLKTDALEHTLFLDENQQIPIEVLD